MSHAFLFVCVCLCNLLANLFVSLLALESQAVYVRLAFFRHTSPPDPELAHKDATDRWATSLLSSISRDLSYRRLHHHSVMKQNSKRTLYRRSLRLQLNILVGRSLLLLYLLVKGWFIYLE